MLLIDSREDSQLSKHIIKLCDKEKQPYEKKWLEIGDYVIQTSPSLCVEAKTTADFLQSVRNNRIFNQVDNMDKEYDVNILLIYGDLNEAVSYLDRVGSSIKWRNKLKGMFVGALASIMMHTDTKVVWVDNYRTAANVVVASYMKIDKKLIIQKQLPKKIRTDDVRIDLLTSIKGITVNKAKLLLKKFGNINEIGNTTEKEIRKIEGIGSVTARNIYVALNSERGVKY
tara:strand:+ start:51 stop:734 length:684 start_codon:yes stop_codon:yes gene_type:complete